MGFDQYHEPPDELSSEVRTFARMIMSLIEEAEAINWYEQRLAVEKDKEAKANPSVDGPPLFIGQSRRSRSRARVSATESISGRDPLARRS